MNAKISLICATTEQRERVVRDFASPPDVDITVHVGGARTLLSVMQHEQPDVVLLDMPESDETSFELIDAATQRVPGVLVLMVSNDASMPVLKRAMRAGVRDVLSAPLNGETLKVALDYLREARANTSRFADSAGEVHAFIPAKGGCGATFLVTNLAYVLAKSGRRVLLIDLNLYFGDAATYLTDRKAPASVVDVARQARRLDSALLESSVLKVRENLSVLVAPDMPYQLEEVTADSVAAIIAQARSQFDFVLLDLGRAMDPATIKALDVADRIAMVVEQSLPALKDARRMAQVFEGLGYARDKVRMVLNCFSKSSLIRAEDVEKATGLSVTRHIPSSDDAVRAAINHGDPLPRLTPKDPVARALQQWAQDMSPMSVKPEKSWFATLTGGL
ncbi:MAG: AAA family ATPase [Burkholderiaceae bacterium]